jgi:ketosteroid isomerase-like protein
MKRMTFVMFAIVFCFGIAFGQRGGTPPPAQDSGPAVAMVKSFLDAYNRQDNAYYQRVMAPDIVLMDDDGHILLGKERVIQMMQTRSKMIPQPQKLIPSGIISQGTAGAAWAGLHYRFDAGDIHREGLISMVFKKVGDDWLIAHFHFSIDQVPANSLDRR